MRSTTAVQFWEDWARAVAATSANTKSNNEAVEVFILCDQYLRVQLEKQITEKLKKKNWI